MSRLVLLHFGLQEANRPSMLIFKLSLSLAFFYLIILNVFWNQALLPSFLGTKTSQNSFFSKYSRIEWAHGLKTNTQTMFFIPSEADGASQTQPVNFWRGTVFPSFPIFMKDKFIYTEWRNFHKMYFIKVLSIKFWKNIRWKYNRVLLQALPDTLKTNLCFYRVLYWSVLM